MQRVALPPYEEGCQDDPQTVACDYPETELKKIVGTEWSESDSTAVALVQNFTWTNEDQNVVAAYIAGRHVAGGGRRQVGRGEPRQGRGLARLTENGRCARERAAARSPISRKGRDMTDMKEAPDAEVGAVEGPRDESGLELDRVVFGVAAVIAVAFVVVGAVWPDELAEKTSTALTWVTDNFGWLFVLTSAGFVLFSAYLALTRYGNIKLGPDDSEPEFSTFSWVSMMFATGMGIGLMFWGVAEPLTHFNSPPLGEGEGGTPQAAELAMQYAFFHWGFHPWAMYAVIGLAIGYFAYRKGYGNLVSATFRPLLGDRVSEGPGKAIDVTAIFATLFGSATSLGLGALQITGGIDDVFGSGGGSKTLAVAVIAVLTGCFVLSAVSGVERGIKILSNANAIAAALLVFFLFVVGPTVFIMGTFTTTIGDYLTQLPAMSFNTGVYDSAASSWLGGWTIFYWAWWISWTPFVGMFIARISKGRTIRQFVIYVILVPSLVSFVWFAILGGTAIDLQLNQGWDPPTTDTGGIALEASLFDTLREFPCVRHHRRAGGAS